MPTDLLRSYCAPDSDLGQRVAQIAYDIVAANPQAEEGRYTAARAYALLLLQRFADGETSVLPTQTQIAAAGNDMNLFTQVRKAVEGQISQMPVLLNRAAAKLLVTAETAEEMNEVNDLLILADLFQGQTLAGAA